MRQLLLDIHKPPAYTLENFVVGRNAQLLHTLRTIVNKENTPHISENFIYIWGRIGSGRSHLLQAVVKDQSLISGKVTKCNGIVVVDDVELLNLDQQQALFNAYNEIRAAGSGVIIVSAEQPPMQLSLREDLRTRLGWGLVFELLELTDDEKKAALYHSAHSKGLRLGDEVVSYLLNHYRRDMPTLIALLEALDQYSLEKKRAITLPLLRELLRDHSTP